MKDRIGELDTVWPNLYMTQHAGTLFFQINYGPHSMHNNYLILTTPQPVPEFSWISTSDSCTEYEERKTAQSRDNINDKCNFSLLKWCNHRGLAARFST